MSFGWTFWHRACYGCLLCGCKLLYQRTSSNDHTGNIRKSTAGEVFETPLCANCVVETEIDEVAEAEVLRKGLRRIEKTDGGVTKQRYKARGANQAGTPKLEPKLEGDGTGGDGCSPSSSIYIQRPNTIWVNICDPIDGPTFETSPLKPIPWFMQQPNWVNTDARHPAFCREPTLSNPLLSRSLEGWSSDTGPSSICPSGQSTPRAIHPQSDFRSPPKDPSTAAPRLEGVIHDAKDLDLHEADYFSHAEPLRPLAFRRKPAYITEEPLQRPSSRLVASPRRSKTHTSAYQTPPESMQDWDHEEQNIAPNVCHPRKPSSPAAAHIASQPHRLMKDGTPAQSTQSVNSSRRDEGLRIARRRAPTEAKTEASGSTGSLRSASKGLSNESSVKRSIGAELRRFFTGKSS